MKPVKIGGADHWVSVSRDVAVAHVIEEYDDDVGLTRCGRGNLGEKKQTDGKRSELGLHRGYQILRRFVASFAVAR
jgi:hypothetical protein